MRFESECRGIDLRHHFVGRSITSRCDSKAIDAVPVAGERLEVGEMQPDSKLTSRDFGRIVAAPYDCCDNDRIASRGFRHRGENHAVTYTDMRVGGEALIYRYGALGRLEEKCHHEQRVDHGLKLADGYPLPVLRRPQSSPTIS